MQAVSRNKDGALVDKELVRYKNTSVLQPHGLNLANNLHRLESKFYYRASRKKCTPNQHLDFSPLRP